MADQTIVALYDDAASARQVLNDLKSSGLPHSHFWISGDTTGTADLGDSRLSDLGRTFTNPGDRVQALTRLGVPEEDAHVYAEGVRRGGTLLIGDVDDDATERALDIIERHNPVDLAERGEHYRSSGWSGYDAGADYSADQAAEERRLYGTGISDAAAGFRDANRTSPATPPATAPSTEAGRVATGRSDVETGREERIPVVEERMAVGKRRVERGRVRVHSHVRETPVEEQVTLRQEHVHVERQPVDRAIEDVPADAFRDRTIEVTETAEEAVVAKEARVREELVVRKDVDERAETVRDTVRRTEVEVENDGGRVGGTGVGSTGVGSTGVGERRTETRGTGTDRPGAGERTREAGRDVAADMKQNKGIGGRIADAAHDAKEDLKGNTGRKDV